MSLEVVAAVLLAAACTVSLWVVGLLVTHAPRFGLVDLPNERSSHVRATPRGGGIGIVPVVAVVLAAAVAHAGRFGSLGWVVVGGLGLAAVSLRDDFRPLGAGVRLVCQLAAAGMAVAGAGAFREVALPGIVVDFGAFGIVLTVVWIVGLTNVYNFMDGIDGIAGIQGVIMAGLWLAVGVALGAPPVALAAAATAGACLGFLRHNWAPARIFMGDVGSAFLGYLFAVLPLLALATLEGGATSEAAGRLPSAALLAVWPFVGDGAYTLLRRAARGERVWTPHRTHLYQRLVVAGWTHARVSTLYGAWAALSAAAAGAWLAGRDGIAVAAAVAAVLGLPLLVAITRKNEARRRSTP